MRYRLVIFDFDGTLADSAPWFREVFNGVAARYGFRKVRGDDEIEALRALSSRDILRHLGVPVWKLPLIARHMRGLAAESAHRIPLFPGVAPMLRRLTEAGTQVAVVSSNAEGTIRRVMGADVAASVAYFECGASMFGKARRIRRLLRRTGVPAREAIVIGDETRDVEAARDAGAAAAAVLWGYASAAAFAGFPELPLMRTVDELADLLGV